ncbi:MAG: hypothetical protein WA672_09255 [Candidatus Angelobacter sp.]
MTFSSQMEAKKFLAGKITLEAAMQGTPLSDGEQKLLLFSEQDPESPTPADIPDDLLYDTNEEYEKEVTRLLKAAYNRDKDNQLELQRYSDAMQMLSKGDHYILVMAGPALAPERTSSRAARDLFIYVVIGLTIVIGITLLAIWKG